MIKDEEIFEDFFQDFKGNRIEDGSEWMIIKMYLDHLKPKPYKISMKYHQTHQSKA